MLLRLSKALLAIWVVICVFYSGLSLVHLIPIGVFLIEVIRRKKRPKTVTVWRATWREFRNGRWGSVYSGLWLEDKDVLVARLSHGLRAWQIIMYENVDFIKKPEKIVVEAAFVRNAHRLATLNKQLESDSLGEAFTQYMDGYEPT